jgi:hypothetical protein
LCLQSGCNLAGIRSLVPGKFDDHSLIMVHLKRIFNGFSGPYREDHFLKSHTVKSDLIYLTFRRVHTLEICWLESRTPEPSGRGWRIYLNSRRYLQHGRTGRSRCAWWHKKRQLGVYPNIKSSRWKQCAQSWRHVVGIFAGSNVKNNLINLGILDDAKKHLRSWVKISMIL